MKPLPPIEIATLIIALSPVGLAMLMILQSCNGR
jgi:hypothetical protein